MNGQASLPFQEIESGQFSAAVNIANGPTTFVHAVQSDENFKQMQAAARTPEGRKQIVERINALTAKVPDPQYENPHDAALAAYLLALNESDEGVARSAAATVRRVPQCWWAVQIAEIVSRLVLFSPKISRADSVWVAMGLADTPQSEKVVMKGKYAAPRKPRTSVPAVPVQLLP